MTAKNLLFVGGDDRRRTASVHLARIRSPIGAALTLYGVRDILKPTHQERPVSSQVFLRLRLPVGPMGRMWNMRMSQGHSMTHGDHKKSMTRFQQHDSSIARSINSSSLSQHFDRRDTGRGECRAGDGDR